MNNSKNMRNASILQILAGVLSIVMVQVLLGSNVSIPVTEQAAQQGLMSVVLVYAADAFKIFAGIVGLAKANKKSLFTVILGVLLFVAQLWTFYQSGTEMLVMIINIVLLAIPYYYLHSAYKNYKA